MYFVGRSFENRYFVPPLVETLLIILAWISFYEDRFCMVTLQLHRPLYMQNCPLSFLGWLRGWEPVGLVLWRLGLMTARCEPLRCSLWWPPSCLASDLESGSASLCCQDWLSFHLQFFAICLLNFYHVCHVLGTVFSHWVNGTKPHTSRSLYSHGENRQMSKYPWTIASYLRGIVQQGK